MAPDLHTAETASQPVINDKSLPCRVNDPPFLTSIKPSINRNMILLLYCSHSSVFWYIIYSQYYKLVKHIQSLQTYC